MIKFLDLQKINAQYAAELKQAAAGVIACWLTYSRARTHPKLPPKRSEIKSEIILAKTNRKSFN
jgi:hypothetical protein